jgi:hypothetical protein
MNTAKILSFKPHVREATRECSFFLGIGMVTVPKGSWNPREIVGGDPYREHALCREALDGSLIMDVNVRLDHGSSTVWLEVPQTQVNGRDANGHRKWEDIVDITPEMSDELIELVHREML